MNCPQSSKIINQRIDPVNVYGISLAEFGKLLPTSKSYPPPNPAHSLFYTAWELRMVLHF